MNFVRTLFNSNSKATPQATQAVAPKPPAPRLGNFEIVKRIGVGAEGSVYTCTSLADNKIYVVKQLKASNPQSKSAEEIKKQRGTISHENIVKFIDAFQAPDPLFSSQQSTCIVLEYCSGGDLYPKINQLSKYDFHLSIHWIMKWLIECTEGLAYLHAKNIVHRDLKPENIFLAQDYSLKLGDFGICKELDQDGRAHTYTGTPIYMAPEMNIAQLTLDYGTPVDIWALGCICYELTSPEKLVLKLHMDGVRGFIRHRGATPEEKEKQKLEEENMHQQLDALIPKRYPNEFKELIFKMLKFDPNERITAEQILQDNYVQKMRQELAEQHLSTTELQKLLNCRSFQYNGKGPYVQTRFGDLTKEAVDAIVVPNSSHFTFTGGLAKFIADQEPSIKEAIDNHFDGSKRYPGMAEPIYKELNSTKIAAKGIIHVVGPAAGTADRTGWLYRTFSNCLQEANKLGLTTICFPAIGTGVANIPGTECALEFYKAIKASAESEVDGDNSTKGSLKEVSMICRDDKILCDFSNTYDSHIEGKAETQL